MVPVSEADIARSRDDPHFRQILLAKALEQLLATLHRMQQDPAHADAASQRQLRDGAMMAVELAELVRAFNERPHLAESA